MKTTVEFLDAVKARHQLTSDYQLAKFLGVRQQTISNYRNRKSGLDEVMAIKVADALALDRAHVLANIAAERTKDEAARKAWQRAAAATAAFLVAVGLATDPAMTQGGGASQALYIMLNGAAAILAALALIASQLRR